MLRSTALPSFVRILAPAAFLLSLASSGVAQSAPAPEATARLAAALQRDVNAYLKDRAAEEHLSSLSVSVSLGKHQPTIDVTAGTTKFAGGRPVRPTDLYQIGSNTKAFTAVAVLQLEAQGRLSIDAPIGRYLPQYPAYAKLTLRRLLSMTGGLESYDNLPAWENAYAKDPHARVSADSEIRLVYPKLKYPPGTKYYYSNTGYLLAQEVVASQSPSRSFDAEMTRIIASAGLEHTFYTSHLYPPAIAGQVVAGYYENNEAGLAKFIGSDMSGYSLSWAQGAGSIVSTPGDLIVWARALYQGTTLLPEKQKRELLSLVSTKTARALTAPTEEDPSGFGLGVSARLDPKLGTFWFYQGETLGFRAAHLYFPSSDLVVSIFANSRPTESYSKLQELFGTIHATIAASNKP